MRSRRPFSGLRGDGGLTLVELIIGLAIGGILLGAATAALTVALRLNDQAGSQVEEAGRVHVLGSRFLPDVQSAEEVGVDPTCDLGLGPADTLLNTFKWTTDVFLQKQVRVAWWLDEGGAVHRTECGGSDPAPTRDDIVARGTDPVGLASIECPDSRCTLSWTAEGRTDPYVLTVLRRAG
jgi:prepilin-type N-terminal cleavage/methylation domain-containing protein